MKLEQVRGKMWIGRIKSTISRTSSYFGYVNFALLLLTFYSVAGYKYAPMWAFFTVAVAMLMGVGAIDYFIVLPAEQAFINQQIARHQNPMYDAIQKIHEEVVKQ